MTSAAVIAFAQNTRNEIRKINGDEAIAGALAANSGMKQTTYIAFGAQNSAAQGDSVSTEVTPTLDKSKTPAVAFQSSQSGVRLSDAHATLDANNGPRRHNGVMQASAVRRLTPVECERLQGFPDNYTQIPWRNKPAENCPDGPRYKAMGNSMAVPVMRWIGERISMVDKIEDKQ